MVLESENPICIHLCGQSCLFTELQGDRGIALRDRPLLKPSWCAPPGSRRFDVVTPHGLLLECGRACGLGVGCGLGAILVRNRDFPVLAQYGSIMFNIESGICYATLRHPQAHAPHAFVHI